MMKRSEKDNANSDLGDLELEVLDLVWGGGWTSVRDVYEALREKRRTAYTTVMTVMTRLHGRGMLERQKDGKSYLYRAAVSREQVTRSFLGRLVDRLLGGKPSELLSYLVSEERIGSEEREAIRRLVEKRAGSGGGAAGGRRSSGPARESEKSREGLGLGKRKGRGA
ncbi:MAG: BlaI/MecI/CopY family transcriptional regulator [Candidatus Wallbacteria bacterium]|nr:BlaI/MecI/CopY family transcriptional regulator [Candidatus Wallbacteria bacterium]